MEEKKHTRRDGEKKKKREKETHSFAIIAKNEIYETGVAVSSVNVPVKTTS